MPHLLHIGMPNTFTRNIQDMFAHDEDNFFLGIGDGLKVPRQVAYALETELMQVPGHHYNDTVVAQVFDAAFLTAQEQDCGSVIISDDRITDGFTLGGVSYAERLARLEAVMPDDTTVLMVVRNPVDYLKAQYKHLIMTRALPIGYRDFVKYLLVRGSKSYLGLLDYASLVGAARAHFNDIEVVLYEQIAQDDEAIHKLLASKGIITHAPFFKKDLAAVSDSEAACFQKLASEQSGTASGHPVLQLDAGDVDTFVENSPAFEDLLLRDAVGKAAIENITEGAKKLAAARPDIRVDYELDMQTEKMLNGYLMQVNRKLAEVTGLPLSHYGYDLGEELEEADGAVTAAE